MTRFKRSLLVVCSSGGHLAEALLALTETTVDTCFVTKFDDHVKSRLGGRPVYFVADPHTSIFRYLQNLAQSFLVFARERPRVVLTTGSGIALSCCLLGWIYGSRIIYVESGARVQELSKTGKLLYRFADVFYVQWKFLALRYPKAIYVGRLG